MRLPIAPRPTTAMSIGPASHDHRYGSGVTTAAWGDALGTFTTDAMALDYFIPTPALGAAASSKIDAALSAAAGPDAVRGVTTKAVRIEIADLDAAPLDTSDAYLRLH